MQILQPNLMFTSFKLMQLLLFNLFFFLSDPSSYKIDQCTTVQCTKSLALNCLQNFGFMARSFDFMLNCTVTDYIFTKPTKPIELTDYTQYTLC